ncbi:MAG: hypothetical protein M1812_005396 [Candelaria pacifica]|nr:MAG: hypothetical protein M1812_005396 [Candelaria pacifica]
MVRPTPTIDAQLYLKMIPTKEDMKCSPGYAASLAWTQQDKYMYQLIRDDMRNTARSAHQVEAKAKTELDVLTGVGDIRDKEAQTRPSPYTSDLVDARIKGADC